MIVLQDDSLLSVWEEYRGLGQLERQNHLMQNWGNRKQRFCWVNGIEYLWGEYPSGADGDTPSPGDVPPPAER